MCAAALLAINIVGKQLKNDYVEEYLFRKVVESFYKMRAPADVPASGGEGEDGEAEGLRSHDSEPLKAVAIGDKQDLYEYLQNDFAKLFFTEGQYVQEQQRIVGPVRLRAQHTKPLEQGCQIVSDHKECYHQEMTPITLRTQDKIDGIAHQDCEQARNDGEVAGEQAAFPCGGYIVDVLPSENGPEDFQK